MSDWRLMQRLSTWHPGEKAIQERAGVAERMEVTGQRTVRDFMPDQHREFFEHLPFIVVGSVNDDLSTWATLLSGKPGFISSPSPTTLEVEAVPDPRDPASEGIREFSSIGLLGVEFHTRRRNRCERHSSTASGQTFSLGRRSKLRQLPKVHPATRFRFRSRSVEPFSGSIEEATELDDEARATIMRADAFFVSTYVDRENRRQVDVSSRGGKPGFVRVDADGTLTIPDFAGNLFFATLGNILVNGNAGMTFVDFENGDLLQMSGDAKVLLNHRRSLRSKAPNGCGRFGRAS